MIRYGDVITDEMRRMSAARRSRGLEARGVRHWGVLGKTAGALFIRSYERGERVHLARVGRGYTGTMPCGGLDTTVLMVTHDLPYALELCPRSVILSGGVIVADGRTQEPLSDDAVVRAHRLELPFGFDPGSVRVEA
ncbi:CbiQ family ECF transporter T component [Streptomyces sp. Wb2n-11]|uniref:CbiQ family ECF transporter T component n=1 Tax=Streptomyces sp. Wb2n-11 TaxID=1030533 RepID=UPI0021004B54|nr:CbiQ family ECF transporter T component [Streptomyces sp. Wb2n-11]